MTATPERWAGLWRQVNASANPGPVFDRLLSLHSEPHRHYHNLRHVSECVAEFDSVRPLARDPVAVELAIWFHDSIYDPRASDNEEQSAASGVKFIREAGGQPALCDAVSSLVLATKSHEPGAHRDAPLLVDIDLAILGQPEARFEEYENQIRQEYEWVPAVLFAEKRAEILQRFLARKRIYSTEPLFARYEVRARQNLAASVARFLGRR